MLSVRISVLPQTMYMTYQCAITTHLSSHVITIVFHYSRKEEVYSEAEGYLRRALALNSALLCTDNEMHLLRELREVGMLDHLFVLYISGTSSAAHRIIYTCKNPIDS